MKRSNFNSRRVLAHIALLLSTILMTCLLPAYGQECDPTWYDPWASPNAAAVQKTQPQAAEHRDQQHQAAAKAKVKSVSLTPSARAAKVRAKSSANLGARVRPS